MKLKLDENVAELAVTMLRAAGHDVATVHEQGLCAKPDTDVIKVCAGEGRGLVTLDAEFGNPLLFPPWEFHGIMVIRLSGRYQRDELRAALDALVLALAANNVDGKLWTVQVGRVREYQPDRPGEAES